MDYVITVIKNFEIINKQSQEYIARRSPSVANPTLIGGQMAIGLETAKPMQLLGQRINSVIIIKFIYLGSLLSQLNTNLERYSTIGKGNFQGREMKNV